MSVHFRFFPTISASLRRACKRIRITIAALDNARGMFSKPIRLLLMYSICRIGSFPGRNLRFPSLQSVQRTTCEKIELFYYSSDSEVFSSIIYSRIPFLPWHFLLQWPVGILPGIGTVINDILELHKTDSLFDYYWYYDKERFKRVRVNTKISKYLCIYVLFLVLECKKTHLFIELQVFTIRAAD